MVYVGDSNILPRTLYLPLACTFVVLLTFKFSLTILVFSILVLAAVLFHVSTTVSAHDVGEPNLRGIVSEEGERLLGQAAEEVPDLNPFQCYAARIPPPPGVDIWSCNSAASKVITNGNGCHCTKRTVFPLPGEAIALGPNDYGSEASCKANCGRGPDDECWLCVETQIHIGGGNVKDIRDCKHVADCSPPCTGGTPTNQTVCERRCIDRATIAYTEAVCLAP